MPWNQPADLSEVHRTKVFSGGACNVIDSQGKLLRNTERDAINNWLTEQNIVFFDPQIHPNTHGVEYDYAIHHPLEMAARLAAKINLYEVSPRTFGGITSFEIAADEFRYEEPTIIYFSDGDADQDNIPLYSPKGYPLFEPLGLDENEQARKAHYKEFIKNGNNMRKYLTRFAREMSSLTVAFTDNPQSGDFVITPERMHASDLFRAVVLAASGERVYVTFTGGDKARDKQGNAIFMAPENPLEIELDALLDQYVDEGNALRESMAKLVHVNVFSRVVYTQKSAIIALEEVMRVVEIET